MLWNILALVFAPMFVLLIHYFKFEDITLIYLVLATIFFIYSFFKKTSPKDMLMPSIYLIALSFAYYFSSIQSVKYIPVTLSSIFLFLFLDSHLHKKYMILGFTRKFYSKKLTDEEVQYLRNGDSYWVGVMLINTLIHLYVVNFTNDIIWAFYASVGWYILFFSALILQIAYGKIKVRKRCY